MEVNCKKNQNNIVWAFNNNKEHLQR